MRRILLPRHVQTIAKPDFTAVFAPPGVARRSYPLGGDFSIVRRYFRESWMLTTATEKDRASFGVRGLSVIVDRAVASHARAFPLLVVVALLSFLPGFFQIPPMHRDE